MFKKILISSILCIHTTFSYSEVVIINSERTAKKVITKAIIGPDGFVAERDIDEETIASNNLGFFSPSFINHNSFVSSKRINTFTDLSVVSPDSNDGNSASESISIAVSFSVANDQKYKIDFASSTADPWFYSKTQKFLYKLEGESGDPIFEVNDTMLQGSSSGADPSSFNRVQSGVLEQGSYNLTYNIRASAESVNPADFLVNASLKFIDNNLDGITDPITSPIDLDPIIDVPLPAAVWLFGSALIGLVLRNKR